MPRVEKQIVKTAEGDMDTYVFDAGADRRRPTVIIYMDAFGVRDATIALGQRFMDAGYNVLLPDLYHRLSVRRFPVSRTADDAVPDDAVAANVETTVPMVLSDTDALLSTAGTLLRQEPGRFALIGYCMGGRHAIAGAAAHPEEVVLAASIHGGRLVTGDQRSSHRILSEFPGYAYLAFARDDHSCPRADQDVLEREMSNRTGPGMVEHLNARHGWSFADRVCFDREASEQVWSRLLGLLEKTGDSR